MAVELASGDTPEECDITVSCGAEQEMEGFEEGNEWKN